MPVSPATLIGHVIDVRGDRFMVDLTADEQGTAPIVTIGEEDVAIGRLGTYVLIAQGELKVVGMVARMTERERIHTAPPGPDVDTLRETTALRTLEIVPVGTLQNDETFERGVSQFPTTGAEVHAIGRAEVSLMFRPFEEAGFDVGGLSSHPDLRVYLDPSPLFGKHFTILGQTGAGKSWTVASLLQKTVRLMPGAHIVLLDLHGEYRQAFQPGEARHLTATELEVPYWLMTYAELCDLLVDRSEITAHNQVAFFRDTLGSLREVEGRRLGLERTTVDTPVYFSLDDMRQSIMDKNEEMVPGATKPKQGDLFGQFNRFLMRLDSRRNDVRYDFLLRPKFRTTSESLEALLRDFIGLGTTRAPITVLDLSPVPFDVRPVVTAQIGRLIFEFNYWNPYYRQFPVLLVCEEAHGYIRREADAAFEGARRSMERIAKEGRKYGVGLALVSQRPHELSETVLSQCGTFICLRITNPDDQTYIRRLVPEAEQDLVSILAGLRRGEAIVLGDAIPVPGRVLFDVPDPRPMSDDVDFRQHWAEPAFMELQVAEIVECWRRQVRRGGQAT